MRPPTQAGRRTVAAAAILTALAFFTSGCAEEDAASADAAAAVIERPQLKTADASGSSDAADVSLDIDDSAGAASSADEEAPVGVAGSALELLETLPVKGRAPKTGYDRTAMFGTAWTDVDHNGCDTRNDILQRDLTDIVLSGRCKVMSGTLADKYTGQQIDFLRGNTTSTLVQIDHVVALSDAWQKGAQQLTQEQRVSLANDPINLFAAQGAANSSKGDGDAATWLPRNKEFRCEYVAHQVSVKAAYALWVTTAEKSAMQDVLSVCPEQPTVTSTLSTVVPNQDRSSSGDAKTSPNTASVPDAAEPTTPAPVTTPVPATTPAPTTTPDPAPTVQPDVYYKNCTAAREAGAAPVYSGQPGYGRHLDRDGDGVGCE